MDIDQIISDLNQSILFFHGMMMNKQELSTSHEIKQLGVNLKKCRDILEDSDFRFWCNLTCEISESYTFAEISLEHEKFATIVRFLSCMYKQWSENNANKEEGEVVNVDDAVCANGGFDRLKECIFFCCKLNVEDLLNTNWFMSRLEGAFGPAEKQQSNTLLSEIIKPLLDEALPQNQDPTQNVSTNAQTHSKECKPQQSKSKEVKDNNEQSYRTRWWQNKLKRKTLDSEFFSSDEGKRERYAALNLTPEQCAFRYNGKVL